MIDAAAAPRVASSRILALSARSLASPRRDTQILSHVPVVIAYGIERVEEGQTAGHGMVTGDLVRRVPTATSLR